MGYKCVKHCPPLGAQTGTLHASFLHHSLTIYVQLLHLSPDEELVSTRLLGCRPSADAGVVTLLVWVLQQREQQLLSEVAQQACLVLLCMLSCFRAGHFLGLTM